MAIVRGRVPTMLRDIAINSAAATPVGRRLYQRHLVRGGYDLAKNDDAYVRSVFSRHWEACGCPTSGAVLELGPGGNVGTARLFAEKGCRPVVCLDTMPYVSQEALGEVEYRAPEAIENTTLPDGSFDFIYSHATLEHVFDPARAVASIGRLLRPGGITSHVVDLRDHRNFNEPHAFLRYPDWLWHMASSRRGGPNRWRESDWSQAFSEIGLEAEIVSKDRVALPADQRLAPKFEKKNRTDLETVGIMIVAQKPS